MTRRILVLLPQIRYTKDVMYIVGADPGRHGAVVVLDGITGKIVDMIPTKMMKSSDVIDYKYIMSRLQPYRGNVCEVWMEQVHAIFGSSAGATFAFGDAFGSLRVALDVGAGLTSDDVVHTVQPKIWQKEAWRGIDVIASPKFNSDGSPVILKSGAQKMIVDTKATSLLAAQNVFPGESFVLPRCRKPHDGVVDAALIGYYGFIMRQKALGRVSGR